MMRVPIKALLKLPRSPGRRVRPGAGLLVAALTPGQLAALVYVLLETSPMNWLPPTDEAVALLGPLLADAGTESRLGIDPERCREIARRTASPEVDALFDQIVGSMRHEHATSTDLPGGRCGDPSDPACI